MCLCWGFFCLFVCLLWWDDLTRDLQWRLSQVLDIWKFFWILILWKSNWKIYIANWPIYSKLFTWHNISYIVLFIQIFSSVQLLSWVRLFVTVWTAAHQASLSITNSWSLLKLMSIVLVMLIFKYWNIFLLDYAFWKEYTKKHDFLGSTEEMHNWYSFVFPFLFSFFLLSMLSPYHICHLPFTFLN